MHKHDPVFLNYKHHYNPALALQFSLAQCPIESWGEGTYLFDERGKAYLDFAAGYGVFSIGHHNTAVQKVAQEQLKKMASSPRQLHTKEIAQLMTKLGNLLPEKLRYMIFVGSGSEAVETALRIALRAQPNRNRLIAATNSYHGKTLGALGIMGQNNLRRSFGPLWANTQFVPYGDSTAMAAAIADGAVAVFLEPIQGGGYLTVPPDGYLADVRHLCAHTNTLLIVDEVQTGFARTGKMFAIEHDNIVPDMMILSKAITGGHTPIAVTVIHENVIGNVNDGQDLAPFPYNEDHLQYPLIYAVASAVIDFITENKLPDHVASVGAYLLQKLTKTASLYPQFIVDAPGRGLMTGIKLRNKIVENAVWMQLLKHGVIGGYSTNSRAKHPVMRLFPPLIITTSEIDFAIDALDSSLAELERKPTLLYDLANVALKVQYQLPETFLYWGVQLLK